MREPKFRAWDKVTERYYAVSGLEYGESGEVCEVYLAGVQIDESNPNANVRKPSEVVLEQYTGIKDKNGKEIYENDILHEKWYDNEAYRGRDRVSKVEYFCDGYECWFRGGVVALGMFPTKHIEVIGNINENPELLKEAK